MVLRRVELQQATPPKMVLRRVKGKMKTAYFWPIYGDRHEVIFPYADSRAHRNVEAFLGDFEGTLLSDGYAAYPAYASASSPRTACWSRATASGLHRCLSPSTR